MKKHLLFLCVMMLSVAALFAQAPQKMSYQAVVRNASNTLVTNQNVSARISILQGSVNGEAVYVETHNVTTNANGLLTLEVGGGTAVSGTMASVNWGNGPFYLKSEIDPTGGINYSITSTQQLMSVPYALYAEKAGNVPAFAIAPVDSGYAISITQPGQQQPQTFFLPTGGQGSQGPEGPEGPQGPAGRGITSITLTGTEGNVDTYTILYTDTTTSTFTVTNGVDGQDGQGVPQELSIVGNVLSITGGNSVTLPTGSGEGGSGTPGADGRGIDSIAKTNTTDNVDTYTIYYSDNTTSTFTVTNGINGTDGNNGENGENGNDGRGIDSIALTNTVDNVDTYTIYYSDNTSSTFTVTNGTNGAPGAPGFSPTVQVQTGTAGTFIIVTDETGTHSYPIPSSGSGSGSGGTLVQQQVDWTETDPTSVSYILHKPTSLSQFNNDLGFITATDIPAQQQADWNTTEATAPSFIKNKPNLHAVATSGDYNDLDNTPNLDNYITSAEVPTLNVTQTDTGYVLTVTQPGGTAQDYILRNGINGEPGTPGEPGAPGDPGDPGAPGTPGTDGRGIASIELTNTVDNVDTYTITYTDETSSTFTVTNGTNGVDGVSPTVDFEVVGTNLLVTITDGNGPTTTTIPLTSGGGSSTQVPADWSATEGVQQILNKPENLSDFNNDLGLATVATSGDYGDLSNTPQNLSDFNNDLDMSAYLTAETDPTVNNVTITIIQDGTEVGSFTTNQGTAGEINITSPTIPENLSDLNNDLGLATVATSGDYGDLSNTPQNLSDFNNDLDMSAYLTAETDPTVNNATITIKQDGVEVGSFTANQGTDAEINLTTPDLSDVENAMDSLGRVISDLQNDLNNAVSFVCGVSKVKDYDGNEYNTVKIGGQCWTKENLRVEHYPDGTDILDGGTNSSSTIGYRYDNTSSSFLLEQRGYLYNWTAVMNGASSSETNPSGVQGICPTGWHVPSDAEWEQLDSYVSGQSAYTCGGNIAKALASTEGWNSSIGECLPGDQSVYENNTTGFSALPTGNFSSGSFNNEGNTTGFWSTTVSSGSFAYVRFIPYDLSYMPRTTDFKMKGLSVRCLRDNTSTVSELLNNLMEQNAALQEQLDSLKSDCGTVMDVDGNEYGTVKIGEQCWMRENLRTTHFSNGTLISSAGPSSLSSLTTSYRYAPGNDENNVATYGYLYNWCAVMNGSSSSDANPSGVQGICPDGWHVPSSSEWVQLRDYLNNNSQYWCSNDNTYIAKALAATTGWWEDGGTCVVGNAPEENNSTGFSALPAGFFAGPYYLGNYAYFWGSSEVGSSDAFCSQLRYDNTTFTMSDRSKYNGCSVRCLRDAGTSGGADMSNYVTKTDDETIGGNKTFTGYTTFDYDAEFDDYAYFNDEVYFNDEAYFDDYVAFYSTVDVYGNIIVDDAGSIVVPSVLQSIETDGTLNVETSSGNTYCGQAVNFCDLQTVYNDLQAKINGTLTTMQNQLNDLQSAFEDSIAAMRQRLADLNDQLADQQNQTDSLADLLGVMLPNYVVPASGSRTVTLSEDVTYLEVYDQNGPNGLYDRYWDGTLTLITNRPNSVFEISGTYDIESGYDYLYLYNGDYTNGENTILELTGDGGTISEAIYTSGDTLTIRFSTDQSVSYDGFALTIYIVNRPYCQGFKAIDVEGNYYDNVQIGNQCWMKENLRATRYADGTWIDFGTGLATDETTPYIYYPNDDVNNLSTYGILYNYRAMMHYATASNSNPSGVQGVCPSGWHVPSAEEFTQLRTYVQSMDEYTCGGNANAIAKALASTEGWSSYSGECVPGDQSVYYNNETGFSAVPAGYYNGTFSSFGGTAYFWSTTGSPSYHTAYTMGINTYSTGVSTMHYDRYDGLSVRCLRNN